MLKKLVVTAAVAASAVAVGAGSAAAAPSDNGACVQAGLGTLKTLGALQLAAQKEIDYSTLYGNPGLTVQLPPKTYLSLGQVVKLHTTNPEYFTWCGGTLPQP